MKIVVETSKIINKYVNTEIILNEEFREINMDHGILTIEERYISHEGYAKEWDKHLKDLPSPDGESGEDVCRRAIKL